MSRIYYLNAKRTTIKPVLVITTSHRLDCFILCLRCLEMYTNLDNFKTVYIVSNQVSREHEAIIARFAARWANTHQINCGPRGLVPAVAESLNAIFAAHLGEVIVKLDEDVFVTPHWLEHLTEAWQAHKNNPEVAAVIPVVPVSDPGREIMARFLRGGYPSERQMYHGPMVVENWVYHRWMWEKILGENLVEAFLAGQRARYQTVRNLSLSCILLGPAMTSRLLPLPMPEAPARELIDQQALGEQLGQDGLAVVAATRCVVHHYGHKDCEDYLRTRVPLDAVWKYMHSLPAREHFRREVLRGADQRAHAKLALVRA